MNQQPVTFLELVEEIHAHFPGAKSGSPAVRILEEVHGVARAEHWRQPDVSKNSIGLVRLPNETVNVARSALQLILDGQMPG